MAIPLSSLLLRQASRRALLQTLHSTAPACSAAQLARALTSTAVSRHSGATAPVPQWRKRTSEEAVTEIISRLPQTGKKRFNLHVFNCFMLDEPGILTRATGIMAARGYNIDSVVVSKTEIPKLSRMTIALCGEDRVIEQAKKQLEDLPQIWAVVDLTHAKVVEREVLLVKVSTLGREFIDCSSGQCTPLHRIVNAEKGEARDRLAQEVMDKLDELVPYDQAMQASRRLGYLRSLAALFQAKIVDVGADCAIVELCAKSDRIDAFMKLVEPFGILEAARTGRMVMSRSAKLSLFEEDEVDTDEIEREEVDLSALPPS